MYQLAISTSFEYLGYGSTTIIFSYFFQLYIRRQILTSRGGSRAERVKAGPLFAYDHIHVGAATINYE